MLNDSNTNKTYFYHKVKHQLEEFYSFLNNEKLTPWLFLKSTGVKVVRYDGKQINIVGVEFSGTCVDVFWHGFIEPFLKNKFIEIMDFINSEVKNSQITSEHFPIIDETIGQYQNLNEKVYKRMSEIDQILRGNGDIASVNRKNVDDKINIMNKFVEDQAIFYKKQTKESNNKNIMELKPSFYGCSIDIKALFDYLVRKINN